MKTFKEFDLPVKHLEGGEHYVPPKARDFDEIERRKQLAPGVLLAELQKRGIEIAKQILELTAERDETLFTTRTLGAAASKHRLGITTLRAPKMSMRRRLTLPNIDEFGDNVTESQLLVQPLGKWAVAEMKRDTMVDEGHEKRRLYVARKKLIGMQLGNSA